MFYFSNLLHWIKKWQHPNLEKVGKKEMQKREKERNYEEREKERKEGFIDSANKRKETVTNRVQKK